MTTPVLPAALKYGRVTGRFLMAVIDGVDPDSNPDARVVTGTITFTPSAPVLLVQTGAAPAQVFLEPITATIDSSGDIRDGQGRLGITLVATDSPDVNPASWTWIASFELSDNARREPYAFHLPADNTVDLAVVAPVRASDGTYLTRGPQGPPGDAGIDWDAISNKPQFAPTATSSSYYALTDRPTLVTRPDLHDAASDAAMTALAAKQGDRVRRTDQSRMYQLRVEPASNLANWIAEVTPGGAAEADVAAATSAPSGNALVRRDVNGSADFNRVRSSGHEITQIGAPSTNPVTGTVIWYLDSADGHLRYRDAGGRVRRPTADWGSGTTLPAAGMLRGDVFFHTGIGCLFVYTGSGWRQAELLVVADAAARAAVATNYSAIISPGFEVRQRDTNQNWLWNGTVWEPPTPGGDVRYQIAVGAAVAVPSATDVRPPFATAIHTHSDVTRSADHTTFTFNRAGVWHISSGYRFPARTTGGHRHTLSIALAGIPQLQMDSANVADLPMDMAVSIPLRLAAGDQIYPTVHVNAPQLNLDSGSATAPRTFFSAVFLRP